jgi:hypothetical protein
MKVVTELVINEILNRFGESIEICAENMCTCDCEKMCPTCQMRKHLTLWLRSQAPGIVGHPDMGKDDD